MNCIACQGELKEGSKFCVYCGQNQQQAPDPYQQAPNQYQQAPDPYQQAPNQYQQTPDPYQQAPDPYQQAPNPYQQAPDPYQQAPDPYQQAPDPYQQAPNQYQQTPDPYQQAPNQYQQAPNPYQQAPNPYQQAPNPYQQAPNQYQQAPDPYQQAPNPYQQAPYPYQQAPNQYQQAPNQYQQAPNQYQQAPYPYQQTPHRVKKKSSGFSNLLQKPLLVVGLAVALLGSVGGYMYFFNEQVVFARSIASSASHITESAKTMLSNMPYYTFFQDFQEETFRMTYQEQQGSVVVEMDYANGQTKTSLNISGAPQMDFYIGRNASTLEIEDIILGVNHETLGTDLNNCPFFEFTVPNSLSFDPYSYQERYIELYEKILEVLIQDLMEEMEIEKISKTVTFTIDGDRESVDQYKVEIPSKSVKSALETAVNSYMTAPVMQESLMIAYGMYGSHQSYDMFLMEVQSGLDMAIEEVVLSLESLDEPYLLFQIHRGKVVGISTADGVTGVRLTSLKEMLDGVEIYHEDESISFSATEKNDLFTIEMGNESLMYTCTYDYLGSGNNVKFFQDGQEQFSFGMESINENSLLIQVEGEEILLEKSSLSTGWYQQSPNYQNVLQMSETDYFQLLMSFAKYF